MRNRPGLGEFEQLVLLAILNLGTAAHANQIRERIGELAKRPVSRGALYATLDRLETKGFLSYALEEGGPARGGIPRRRFVVTASGVGALRQSLAAVRALASGLERIVGHAG